MKKLLQWAKWPILAIATLGIAALCIYLVTPTFPHSELAPRITNAEKLPIDTRLEIASLRIAAEANRLSYSQAFIAAISAICGVITLFAAIAAAAYAKHAANESRRGADISQAALVASERAWITVTVQASSDLTFSRHGDLSLGFVDKG